MIRVERLTATLHFEELEEGSATNVDIAKHLHKIFKDFSIDKKVTWVITDGGSNFRVCFKVFGSEDKLEFLALPSDFEYAEENAGAEVPASAAASSARCVAFLIPLNL